MKFDDLDFWLVRGFGGILNILNTRITQFDEGFSRKNIQLLLSEQRRLSNYVGLMQERESELETDINNLDAWFIGGFSGLIKYLDDRIKDGPPLSEVNRIKLTEFLQKLKGLYDGLLV